MADSQFSYYEQIIALAYSCDILHLQLDMGHVSCPFLHDLSLAVARVAERAKTHDVMDIDTLFKEEVLKKLKPGSGKKIGYTPDREHFKTIGRAGGISRSKRKRTSSASNGRLGGRPPLDTKTRMVAERIYQLLRERDPKAWHGVANYQLSPRVLRRVSSIIQANQDSFIELGLPREWDPSPQSKDPIRRNAAFARKYGFSRWPRRGPAPRRYSDAFPEE